MAAAGGGGGGGGAGVCESEPVLALSAEVAALRAAVSSALAGSARGSGDTGIMAESVARMAMSLDELRGQARILPSHLPRCAARLAPLPTP